MLPGTQSQRISAEAEEVRHPAWRSASPQPSQGHMYSDALYSFTIGFVGAILFLLVDKYQPVGPLARLLKFLILFVAGVAILHKLLSYGLALF
jgi:hypothetical protein